MDISTLTFQDFNSICRFCLKTDLILKPIFEQNVKNEILEWDEFGADLSNSITIPDLITTLTNIHTRKDDQLPQFMCTNCFDLVENILKFRISSISSYDILVKLLPESEKEVDMFTTLNFKNHFLDELGDSISIDSIKVEDGNNVNMLSRTRTSNQKKSYKEEPISDNDDEDDIQHCNDDPEIIISESESGKEEEKQTKRKYTKKIDKLATESKPREKSNTKKQKTVNLTVCEICGESQRHITQHMRVHSDIRPYACEFCEKRFKVRNHLLRHTYIHTNERPYKCTQCDKAYTSAESLKSHKIVHTGEKNHECEICHRRFNLKSAVRNHMETHIQNRRYECKECGKKFLTGTDFRQHYRIHTGEKPYECKICSEKFRTAGMLGIHMKKIHPDQVQLKNEK